MDNLFFGTTARRRALRRQRARRLVLLVWAVSTAGLVVGAPATIAGFNLSERGSLAQTEASPLPISKAITIPHEMDGRGARLSEGHALLDPNALRDRADLPRARKTPYRGASIKEVIYAAGKEFRVDGDYLLAIANCESGLDPRAYNSAGYHGLFQYDESTWGAYGYGSIWDPVAQARTTARLIAQGQSSRWPNCA
ncbi:MAG: transglycosylase SLT domain-containing protein [Actinomycetota bacterium]|nr:transglycosylase SLT domain-containing protein [Actinomycetota bacterium]